MGQAIGITHVFPNATVAASGTFSAESVVIPISDIEGLSAAEASGFSVDYVGTYDHDDDGSATSQNGTYTGNAEKFIYGILKSYAKVHKKVRDAYTADQAASAPAGYDQGPDAIVTAGFSALQGSTGTNLQSSINLKFIHPAPSVDLLDEDD